MFRLLNPTRRTATVAVGGMTVLTTVLGLSAMRVWADSITLANGAVVKGCTIESATWKTVRYQVGKATQSKGGHEVLDLQRSTDSRDLASGRKALEDGQFGLAVKRLSKVNGKAWEEAEAAYLLSEAHRGSGDLKAAEEQLESYLANYEGAKDWWVPRAIYTLGIQRVKAKKFDLAVKTFKRLDDFVEPWAARAKLGRAEVAVRGDREKVYVAVLKDLSGVARSRRLPVDVREHAYVLRSEIFIRRKQNDRAIQDLKTRFFNSSKPTGYSSQRAAAMLLMGLAYRAKGGKESLEKAEIWLLKVSALHRNEGDVYRRACAVLSEVYTELGRTNRAAEWRRRVERQGKKTK